MHGKEYLNSNTGTPFAVYNEASIAFYHKMRLVKEWRKFNEYIC